MNKLVSTEENPLDVALYGVTGSLLPLFYDTGHTANDITTYSFVCGLLAVCALWQDHLAWFAGLFALSYAFDCMDGQLARAYNMTSEFGDVYDHVTDILVYVLLGVTVLVHPQDDTLPRSV